MSIRVIRTFHPVGQGAFYSETIIFKDGSSFVMVYDCGSRNKKEVLQKAIDEFVKTVSRIDILFISHFDSDHVNGIEYLLSKIHVSKIVIPLISSDEYEILKVFPKIPDQTVLRLLYFADSDTKTDNALVEDSEVIVVNYQRMNNGDFEKVDIDNLEGVVFSGVRIKISKELSDYVYIPFNIGQNSRKEQLDNELKKEGINKQNIDAEFMRDKANIRILRRIYRKMDGTINSNSTCLYSGPLAIGNNRVGCLYTGDYDAKNGLNDLKNAYSSIWGNISLIQVPHHGSKNSHNKELYYNNKNIVTIVSHSIKHLYGHPHKEVFKDVLSLTGLQPISISESTLCQFLFNY